MSLVSINLVITTSSIPQFTSNGGHFSLDCYFTAAGHAVSGPVKICAIGKGRGRGLVVTADVVAGQLLVVSNPLAKACKVETEVAVEGNYRTGESGRWTGSHVLADELVATLVARAWKSSREREMLCTLCSGDDEELPVPPMELFQPRVSASLEPAMQVTTNCRGVVKNSSNMIQVPFVSVNIVVLS